MSRYLNNLKEAARFQWQWKRFKYAVNTDITDMIQLCALILTGAIAAVVMPFAVIILPLRLIWRWSAGMAIDAYRLTPEQVERLKSLRKGENRSREPRA